MLVEFDLLPAVDYQTDDDEHLAATTTTANTNNSPTSTTTTTTTTTSIQNTNFNSLQASVVRVPREPLLKSPSPQLQPQTQLQLAKVNSNATQLNINTKPTKQAAKQQTKLLANSTTTTAKPSKQAKQQSSISSKKPQVSDTLKRRLSINDDLSSSSSLSSSSVASNGDDVLAQLSRASAAQINAAIVNAAETASAPFFQQPTSEGLKRAQHSTSSMLRQATTSELSDCNSTTLLIASSISSALLAIALCSITYFVVRKVKQRHKFDFVSAKHLTCYSTADGKARRLFAASASQLPLSSTQTSTSTPTSLHDSFNNAAFENSCCESSNAPIIKTVELIGRDFIGLGLTVAQDARNKSLLISQLLASGPAAECKQLAVGDKLLALSVSFEGVSLNDAIELLTCASAYKLRLLVEKRALPMFTSANLNTSLSILQQRMLQRNACNVCSRDSVSLSSAPSLAVVDCVRRPQVKEQTLEEQEANFKHNQQQQQQQSASTNNSSFKIKTQSFNSNNKQLSKLRASFAHSTLSTSEDSLAAQTNKTLNANN